MKKRLYIANWKMNLTSLAAATLAQNFKKIKSPSATLIVAPSLNALERVATKIKSSKIALSAQNLAATPKGAFTGEVSGAMLRASGCKYVLIGHSERRKYFGETDATVNQKMQLALDNKLTPILCVGETLVEREKGERDQVIARQLREAFAHIAFTREKVIVAYEPVWAIGTGKVASPADVEHVLALIKKTLSKVAGSEYFEKNVAVVYGGSVDPSNVADFKRLEALNGFLVGGASLNYADFSRIIGA
jgi:triosephosphate isomerase